MIFIRQYILNVTWSIELCEMRSSDVSDQFSHNGLPFIVMMIINSHLNLHLLFIVMGSEWKHKE